MRFLLKPDGVPDAFVGLRYGPDSPEIRENLLSVQQTFCAYSEKYLKELDSVDIEHFDPRLKSTPGDGFRNWYAVVHKINGRRQRKVPPETVLPDPGTTGIQDRIKYEDGQFQAVESVDEEIEDLILFIRANDELTMRHRASHVSRIADLRRWKTEEELNEYLLTHPEELSFPSALESELGIPAFELIRQLAGDAA